MTVEKYIELTSQPRERNWDIAAPAEVDALFELVAEARAAFTAPKQSTSIRATTEELNGVELVPCIAAIINGKNKFKDTNDALMSLGRANANLHPITDTHLVTFQTTLDSSSKYQDTSKLQNQFNAVTNAMQGHGFDCFIKKSCKNCPLLPKAEAVKEEAEEAAAEIATATALALVENLNRTISAALVGGAFKVLRKTPAAVNYDNREGLEYLSKSAMLDIYENKKVQLKGVWWNPMAVWLSHPKANIYTGGVVFRPAQQVPEEYLNLWQGFAVEPQQGADLGIIHKHIHSILCSGNSLITTYVLDWVAFGFQHPDKPVGSAVIFKGSKGTGKGILGHFLRRIWGQHGLHISNGKHLVGNFNGHLADCCFLYADEAFFAGDTSHESVLKAIITEPVLTIERKGIDVEQRPNFLKVLMTSNSEYTVPASIDERRYCVSEVSDSKRGDRDYFKNLLAETENNEVQAAFLFEMLNRDISQFVASNIPETTGLQQERLHSLDSVGKFMVDYLGSSYHPTMFKSNSELQPHYSNRYWTDDIPLNAGLEVWVCAVPTDDLFDRYSEWCKAQRVGEYKLVTQQRFSKVVCKIYGNSLRIRGKRHYNLGYPLDAITKFEEAEKVVLECKSHWIKELEES